MYVFRSIAATVGLLTAGCGSLGGSKIQPVSHLDLDRYMGAWRVIAFMDNAAERNFTGAIESYERRTDDRIGVHFEWRHERLDGPRKTHEFTGKVVDRQTNAQWSMRLFPLFHASYIVIGVGDQYEWAAVAHPSRKFGWVLARKTALPSRQYERILKLFEQQGFETSKFVKMPQPRR